MEKSFLALDYETVRHSYPLCLKVIKEWFMENVDMAKAIGVWNAPESEKQEVFEKVVASVVQFDPRKLYDAFDDMGCRIFIVDHEDTRRDEKPLFYFYNNINRASTACHSRREAEQRAFMDAFMQMEKILEDGENKERVQAPD
jgi:hypothetical protein